MAPGALSGVAGVFPGFPARCQVTPVVPVCSFAQRQVALGDVAVSCRGDLADRPKPRLELHQPHGSGGECKHLLLWLRESPQGFPSSPVISICLFSLLFRNCSFSAYPYLVCSWEKGIQAFSADSIWYISTPCSQEILS